MSRSRVGKKSTLEQIDEQEYAHGERTTFSYRGMNKQMKASPPTPNVVTASSGEEEAMGGESDASDDDLDLDKDDNDCTVDPFVYEHETSTHNKISREEAGSEEEEEEEEEESLSYSDSGDVVAKRTKVERTLAWSKSFKELMQFEAVSRSILC